MPAASRALEHAGQPGDQQDDDLDEVVEEADEAHQAGDGIEDRLARIDADLRQPSGLKELGGADGVAAGQETKVREGMVDDRGEVIVVAEDEPGSLNGDALDEYARAWAEAVNRSGEGYLIVIRLWAPSRGDDW